MFSAMIQAKDPTTDQEYNMRDVWSESMALLGAGVLKPVHVHAMISLTKSIGV